MSQNYVSIRGVKRLKMNVDPNILLRKNRGYVTKRLGKYYNNNYTITHEKEKDKVKEWHFSKNP